MRPCTEPGERSVWRRAADGEVIEERVCTRHLADAMAFGFREPRIVLSPPELRALLDVLPPDAALTVELGADAIAALEQARGAAQ